MSDATKSRPTIDQRRASLIETPLNPAGLSGLHADNVKAQLMRRPARRLKPADINFRLKPQGLLISLLDSPGEVFRRTGAYEAYCAAPKAGAGHARSINTPMLQGKFHENIELTAAHFIVVPQTFVRLRHQPSEAFHVAFLQGIDSALNAMILGHHMPCAFKEDSGERLSERLEFGRLHFPQ